MKATWRGREYRITAIETGKLTAAELIAKGWDGTAYIGESEPTGRQRIAKTALFYRRPSGGFEAVSHG